ncbi:succinylglutamate desuccinylase [Pseudoduganella namucuonensis]|uniref:Succinylglutamate desuccinylase n=1 Tax=Pseudoduganella namucuonensis TaxID=1035707 RepID=A0A1I7LAA7_9BURK|nr:succinylglutamate desuccinylase [Pseudoduganella namucuonensis]SFV06466.1 succinylglutamate desuccinylase [Pseudoduganella namucuonensis]
MAAADNNAPPGQLPAPVRALAEADFSAVASRFAAAGFVVGQPADGILTIRGGAAGTVRPAVLVSVGVHGDETGPIEIMAYLLDALSREPGALAVDLMLCVGNIGAIRAGKRFIDADLNRMFRAERGTLAGTAEAARADDMMAATDAFFAGAGPARWHLDLHTAIRPSHYPAFAIVPELIERDARATLISWLGDAGIGAVIMNPKSVGTYSYYAAEHHAAAATTVELGRIGTLGRNDLEQFAAASAAMDALLRGRAPAVKGPAPHVFNTARQVIKLSDQFTMAFGKETWNFTPLPLGAEIARDGDTVYRVEHAEELVVFPNPDVRVGLRAALMVVRAA